MDKRVVKTHKNIKESFLIILKEKSLEKVAVKDICDRAGIVRKTFYLHYDDKYDLLEKIMNQYIEEFEEICKHKKQVGFLEGNLIWFKYLEDNKSLFNIFLDSSISSLFAHKIEKIIEAEVHEKINYETSFNQKINSKTLLQFLTSAVLGVMVNFTTGKIERSYEEVAEEVALLISQYMVEEKSEGTKIVQK